MKIGLIGENPNDTDAIAALLKKQHKHDYIAVLKRRTGDQLENDKFSKLLQTELKTTKYDALIFVRDLDGFESDEAKLRARGDWFNRNKALFGGESVFFLNIHELESIFFSDVDSLNKIFKIKLKFRNPLFISKPKEELKKLTSAKYHENRAAEYMVQLDYATVLSKYKPLKEIDDFLNQ